MPSVMPAAGAGNGETADNVPRTCRFRHLNELRGFILSEQPGSVAVNHAGLWIPRQQFESAPGYTFLSLFSSEERRDHACEKDTVEG